MKNNIFPHSALATIATCVISSSLHAQTIDEQITVTAKRIQQNIQQQSAQVSVLNDALLSLYNPQHLNQVLQQASSVWLSRGNGQESLLAIRSPVYTGAGACSEFITLQDNIPLRAAGFCNVNQLFDSGFELAEKIEIAKGASSALYGTNAIHGVINVLTPTPNGNKNISLTAGPDAYLRSKLNWSEIYDDSAVYTGLSYTHDGGFQHSSGYNDWKLIGKYQLNKQNLEITNTISAHKLKQDTATYLQQGQGAYKNKHLLRENSVDDAYRETDALTLSSAIKYQSANYSWQLTPYIRHNRMQFLMHFLPGTPTEKNGHHSVGLQSQYQSQVADNIDFVAGADIEWTKGFLQQQQTNATDSGSAFLDNILPQGQQYDYSVTALNSALYALINIPISDKITSTTNIRFDTIHYNYDNKMLDGNSRDDGSACAPPGCRYTRPADTEDHFDMWSWQQNIQYQIKNNLVAYLKLDTAFRAPHTSELYRLQNGQLDAQIEPQKAKSIEIGQHYIDGSHTLNLAAYWQDKSEVIIQNSQREYLNGAKTQHMGIEAEYSYQFSDDLSANLQASHALHRYKNDENFNNNIMDTAPKLMLAGRLNWRLQEKLQTELEYQYMDKYFTSADNTTEYDGHQLFNLRLNYQMSNNLRFSAQVLNLLDERYAERADYAFSQYRYFVGQPRRLFLGVNYEL
ncbi:TonB-dependent receptor [Catenovulum sediminis]